jgi:hypothetical protein
MEQTDIDDNNDNNDNNDNEDNSIHEDLSDYLWNSDGNNLVTFKPVRNYSSIIFSCPELKTGATYYIYTGGSSAGTSDGGLYKGGTYSGGSQNKSFALSGKLTSVSF